MYLVANRNSFANGEVGGLQVASVKFVKYWEIGWWVSLWVR